MAQNGTNLDCFGGIQEYNKYKDKGKIAQGKRLKDKGQQRKEIGNRRTVKLGLMFRMNKLAMKQDEHFIIFRFRLRFD